MIQDQQAHRRDAAYRACTAVPCRQRAATAHRAVLDAMDLAGAVRTLDPREVWGSLELWNRRTPARLYAAIVALAAMIPQDQAPSALLAWTEQLKGDTP